MAVTLTQLSWWLWGGKHQEPKISNGSALNSSPESGLLELDIVRFPLVNGGNISSSSRRVKRKWHSREERKIDREHDVVVVSSDGGCFSGSDSDDSDWSIGWLEPHGPGFQSEEDSDDSFAVLVPCYGRGHARMEDNYKGKFLDTIGKVPNMYAAGKSHFLQKFSFVANLFMRFSLLLFQFLLVLN